MSGESIFSATGKPSWVAIIIASLALRASTVCVTGMWKADSSDLDSISVSTLRRSASTLSMTRRAPSMSGLARPVNGGGVCCSSCWFWSKVVMLPKAPTAASGVRKFGMLASLSSARASATEASPIQQASSGLPIEPAGLDEHARRSGRRRCRTRGEHSTSTPSTVASAPAAATAAAKCSGPASAERSIRSSSEAAAGSASFSAAARGGGQPAELAGGSR